MRAAQMALAMFAAGLAAVTCIVVVAQAHAERPVSHVRYVEFADVSDSPDDGSEKRRRDAQAQTRRQLAELSAARIASEAAESAEEAWIAPDAGAYAEYGETAAHAPSDASDFRTAGVVYGDDGTRYTWYSERVLPGGGLDELNANGRHVTEDGYVADADGYIAVASSDLPMGSVVETPFGAARVYDTGCASGTVDVYVGW